MVYTDVEKLGVGLKEGIDPVKVYPIMTLCKAENVELFTNRGYDLSALNTRSFKLFTVNDKEKVSLINVLDKIDSLNLKEIFNSNLDVLTLKDEVVKRVEYCLNNRLPFVHQESNALISVIYDNEGFAKYTANQPSIEVNAQQEINVEPQKEESIYTNTTLDIEDNEVRSNILKTLLEIKEANKDDFTFGFLITNVIANLDGVIISDNKNYRMLGTRHIIERALEGVSLTPEMKEEIDIKLLSAFSDSVSMGRSA